MIRLLVLLSLLPSFTLAKDYAISNPETIFITQESLLSNLKKTENHNKTCENEKFVKYDLVDLKANKSLRGHLIGEEIRLKLNPILKTYCNF